eukprot:1097636_1
MRNCLHCNLQWISRKILSNASLFTQMFAYRKISRSDSSKGVVAEGGMRRIMPLRPSNSECISSSKSCCISCRWGCIIWMCGFMFSNRDDCCCQCVVARSTKKSFIISFGSCVRIYGITELHHSCYGVDCVTDCTAMSNGFLENSIQCIAILTNDLCIAKIMRSESSKGVVTEGGMCCIVPLRSSNSKCISLSNSCCISCCCGCIFLTSHSVVSTWSELCGFNGLNRLE